MEACGVEFLHEITVAVLRRYKTFKEREGFAGKTIDTRLNITRGMLKKFGVTAVLPKGLGTGPSLARRRNPCIASANLAR